ncbi:MAG TPA: ferritin-like domain-containing protein [Gaiellaceae bacterium]|jgi:ferritin-like metal-binding protein YciE
MKLDSLQDVFEEQVSDLYDAEQQLLQALPKVAQAAGSDELRTAITDHLEETRGHVQRLEQIFEAAGITRQDERCEAMEGILREGDEIVTATGDPTAKDAALIAAAQRVEHYEIAGYGTARTLAGELGFSEAESLLEETLDEESKADKLLTKIATGGMLRSGINAKATN